MPDIKKHKRINDILLGPIERPALQWFAAHMPDWVMPDHLTLLGTLGAILIFISYWLTNFDPAFLWLASVGFFVNWFGDSLDGTLARYREIQRPKYGFFVDHIVDAFNEALIFLGFGLSPYIRFEIASLLFIGYLMMSVLVYVRTCVKGEFVISYAGLGPTEMRVLAIIANILLYFFGNPSLTVAGVAFSVFDLVGFTIALALFAVFIISSYSQARELARIDPVKK